MPSIPAVRRLKQVDPCELEVRLVCIGSSSTARPAQSDPVSKEPKRKKGREERRKEGKGEIVSI